MMNEAGEEAERLPIVRLLEETEILPALHLVWEVFARDVAPGYTPEGVGEFQKFIRYDGIIPMVKRKELTFFGAWKGETLCGVGAVRRKGHISLFFVKKEWQHRGIGRMIFQTMCHFAEQNLQVDRITVNAAPNAVPVYRSFGMRETGPEQNAGGIRFVPMEMPLIPGGEAGQKARKKRNWIIAGIVAACVAFFALIVGIGAFAVYKIVSSNVVQEFRQDEDLFDGDWNNKDWNDKDDTYDAGELSGMDAIPEYREDNTGYELTEESYVLHPGESGTKNTKIAFEIYYPQITGLDGQVQEKVNAALKEKAMETADRIYLNPDEKIKEKVIQEKSPVLASFVEYKVCYLSKDLISVVYQDYYYEGSESDYHMDFRTLNMNLKNGNVYEVKDIVELNKDFIEEWAEEMRDEADSEKLLSELSEKEMKEVLSGDDKDGVYHDNFFLDSEGIEIGLGFRYPADDKNDLGFGWVTAPFEMDDIREFKTDSDFWTLIK
ncbi:MAG: GNAT family N-acetyltransferase [Lachnoclostridium sp.]|nr:GNAT family N-acetyltransferase [Lachnoclostridium sp.]